MHSKQSIKREIEKMYKIDKFCTRTYTDKHKNRLIANVGVRNVNPVHKKWTQPQQKEAKKMNV